MQHDLKKVAAQFQLPGKYLSGKPYGSGHINDTYAVSFNESGQTVRYIFQRINHTVFKDPAMLMDNLVRATRHIRTKLEEEGAEDIDRRVLTTIPALDGADYLHDDDGLYWRVYIFIEQALTYDIIESTQLAEAAAKAFGKLALQLADLPGPRLGETIPNFHNTPARMQAFMEAVEHDPCNRAANAKTEIEAVLRHQPLTTILTDLLAAGEIPERIIHNDTKLNNVMIDNATTEGILRDRFLTPLCPACPRTTSAIWSAPPPIPVLKMKRTSQRST